MIVNHGMVVFVNKQEFDRANFVFDHSPLVTGVCVVIAYIMKVKLKKV